MPERHKWRLGTYLMRLKLYPFSKILEYSVKLSYAIILLSTIRNTLHGFLIVSAADTA